jgi:hypothetical protein
MCRPEIPVMFAHLPRFCGGRTVLDTGVAFFWLIFLATQEKWLAQSAEAFLVSKLETKSLASCVTSLATAERLGDDGLEEHSHGLRSAPLPGDQAKSKWIPA